MKRLSKALFWIGILCIPLSWVMWHLGPHIEIGRPVIGDVADAALRAALREAHAERWGIFVGLWPVTLLALSHIIGKKSEGGN